MDSTRNILQKAKRTISRHHMIRPGDLVIAAVSGGPDSVCLLHILHELKAELNIHLIVAHFDHGLRPVEDDSETDFVRGLAQSLNLPFESGRSRTSLRTIAGSREEVARDARYAFLEGVREKYSAQKIALGHNLNDQAETMLMRLLRGSGPAGLTGIPPCRDGSIIRPLIQIERREIEAYLKRKNLPSVTDSSNLTTDFFRNRIRLDLMPRLEEHQPRLARLLGQTAEILRDEDEYLGRISQAWVAEVLSCHASKSWEISIASLLALPLALQRRVIRILIGRAKCDLRRITWDHIEAILHLAKSERPQASLGIPGPLQVERRYDRLCLIEKKEKQPMPLSCVMDSPGRYRISEIGRTLAIEEIPKSQGLRLRGSKWTVFLDAEKLPFPLTLRTFKAGDRFIPLGMKGHKKLKDFFVDLKVPREERRCKPILCRNDKPVWVCGCRIDDRFKVSPETRRVLKVTLSPGS